MIESMTTHCTVLAVSTAAALMWAPYAVLTALEVESDEHEPRHSAAAAGGALFVRLRCLSQTHLCYCTFDYERCSSH